MAKLSYAELQAVVADYVDDTLISTTFSATANNIVGLLDKIGKIVTFDTAYIDKLAVLDGEELSFGKTIEEWQEDLQLPTDYDSTGANTLAPHDPTYRPVAYSYSLGKKVIATTLRYNDVERAVNNASEFGQIVAMKSKRLYDSEASFKYNCKREVLAKLADLCEDEMTANTTIDATTTRAVGFCGKYGTPAKQYIFVKPYTANTEASVSAMIEKGYIIELALSEVVTLPTDTSTGEAFIEQVKKDVEIASDLSEGHSLNGNSLGASEGLVLVVKQGIMPVINVQVEAGAFQLDKVAIPAQVIPVVDFGSDTNNVYAMLIDTRAIRLHNGYRALRSQENAEGDFMNLFLHLEYTAHISRNTFVKVYKSA